MVGVPYCLWGVAVFNSLCGKGSLVLALPTSPLLPHGKEFLPSLCFPVIWCG